MQWTTRDKGSPEVQWGLSATSLTHTAAGSGFTYNQSNLCGAPATTDGWVDPGYLQVAKMTGLKDSTRYYYKYGQVSHACQTPFVAHKGCSFLCTLNSPCILVKASNHIRLSMLLMQQRPFSKLVDSNHDTCSVTLLALSFRAHGF